MHFDVVVVGAGMIGLAVVRGLLDVQDSLCIAVIDVDKSLPGAELRVSAINHSTVECFKRWGVWTDLHFPDRAGVRQMEIWEAHSSGKLCFHASDLGQEALNVIVKNISMIQALKTQLKSSPQVHFFMPVEWTNLERISDSHWEVELSDGRQLSATWLIGADGAASRVRECLKIETAVQDYAQEAMVANIHLEHPHQSTAYQRFLSGGPLAILPLNGAHEASIVWTLSKAESDHHWNLNDADFNQALTAALDHRLGALSVTSARLRFPLKTQHAKSYVASGACLIGDAAHSIHPLAGQGVNLGFHDVKVLCEILECAKQEGRPVLTLSHFKKYERQAWMHNEMIRQGMSLINSLFLGEKKSEICVKARGFGMNFVDHFGIVKNWFSQVAQG